jgi:hypothetical protein
VFVGLPKWEYWKTRIDTEPNYYNIGKDAPLGNRYVSRKEAKQVADKLDANSDSWHYIVNPSWDQGDE